MGVQKEQCEQSHRGEKGYILGKLGEQSGYSEAQNEEEKSVEDRARKED